MILKYYLPSYSKKDFNNFLAIVEIIIIITNIQCYFSSGSNSIIHENFEVTFKMKASKPHLRFQDVCLVT
jgi:hypothetical protein